MNNKLFMLILFLPTTLFSQVSNWSSLGPSKKYPFIPGQEGYGRVTSVRFSSDFSQGNFYVGTPGGGLWKWDNVNTNWQLLNTDNLPHIGVSDEAIDVNNLNHIYIATGDGDLTFDGNAPGLGSSSDQSRGIFESTDGGLTWSSSSIGNWYDQSNTNIISGFWDFPSRKAIKRILISPDNSNTLITIVSSYNIGINSEESFIYKSTDAGQNWFVKFSLVGQSFYDLEFKPGDPSVVYVSGKDIFRSTDSGDNWNQIVSTNHFSRIEVAVTIDDPDGLYYLHVNSGVSEEIHRWDFNSGTPIDNLIKTLSGHVGGNRRALAVDPNYKFNIFCSDLNDKISRIYSLNQGSTWITDQLTVPHKDIHDLTFEPVSSILYASTDGGLFTTNDNGITWIYTGNGMTNSQMWSIATAQTDNDVFLDGLQDNGTILHNSNYYPATTDNWGQIVGGDGMECEIDIKNKDILFQSDNQPGVWGFNRITLGNSSTSIRPETTCLNYKPISTHPLDENILYAGYTKLYTSHNKGDNWNFSTATDPTPGNSGDYIFGMSASPINPSILYINYLLPSANHLERIFKSSDGGINWTDLGLGDAICPSNLFALEHEGIVTAIAVDYYNPDIIYLGFWGGESQYRIYKGEPIVCNNQTYYNWADYSTGIPPTDVWWIQTEKGSSNLYAGTSQGVYYRNNSTTQWQPFKDNLPNTRINKLAINNKSNEIFAATHGRGAWKSHLACPSTPTLNLNVNTVNDEFDEAYTINSTATVSNNIKAKYRAVDEINLTPNFEASIGSDIDIFIHGCDGTGNSYKRIGQTNNNKTAEINSKTNSTITDYLLFPNPTNGKFYLINNLENQFYVSIINSFGKVIYENKKSDSEFSIDISKETAGVYYVKIFEGNLARVIKLIHT